MPLVAPLTGTVLVLVTCAVTALTVRALWRAYQDGELLESFTSFTLQGVIGVLCTLALSGGVMIAATGAAISNQEEISGLSQLLERWFRSTYEAVTIPPRDPLPAGSDAKDEPGLALSPRPIESLAAGEVEVAGAVGETEALYLRALFSEAVHASGGAPVLTSHRLRIELVTLSELAPRLVQVRALARLESRAGGSPGYGESLAPIAVSGMGADPASARASAVGGLAAELSRYGRQVTTTSRE